MADPSTDPVPSLVDGLPRVRLSDVGGENAVQFLQSLSTSKAPQRFVVATVTIGQE